MRCSTIPQIEPPELAYRKVRNRIWTTQVVANLVGASFCMIYFMVLDPVELPEHWQQTLVFPLVMTAALMVLGSILVKNWSREIDLAYTAMEAGQDPAPELMEQARRKVLSGPLVMAWMSLGIWVLAALVMSGYRFWEGAPDERLGVTLFEAARVLVGVLISGVATASTVFFKLDRLFRRVRPYFFPQGGLTSVQGVRRIRVEKRLRYAFALVTVIPMLVVVMVVHHKALAMARADADPRDILESLWYILGFLTVANLSMGLVISRLVSDSIAGPVTHLERAMHQVQEGHLETQAQVTDNDELGCLADDFNHMVKKLGEREQILEVFGKYVTKEVRDQILSGKIPLDGEVREVTLLFADLRDFTPMVEATPPKDVVRIMNYYFTQMTQAIRDSGGLVLQYVGDEIEAVFGAPMDLPDHPAKAVKAALTMRALLEAVNRELESQGHAPLRHGIGVHTGQAVAANIGSPDRLSYALVGDTVNLASRIQGLTKVYHTDVLVSSTTVGHLNGDFVLERLPATQVKGKSRPVEVFSLEG